MNPVNLFRTGCARPPTSVAWSVWSLMLMKVCSSLSRPSLVGESKVPWFSRTLSFAEPCGPHKLSTFVSRSLKSFSATSARLGASLERMLGRKRMHGAMYKQSSTYVTLSHREKASFSSPLYLR